jgi:peptidoglycan/LPS O-acetylase OafA/YrhL
MSGRLDQLESLRGFAALYVMLHHISSNYLHLQQTVWGAPFRFGQEAVLVFFLLSGFVICYSWERNAGRSDFAVFMIKRARRIYPIFILALLIGWLVQCHAAGAWLAPGLRNLAGNLFMLQDLPKRPGGICEPFAQNMPLWSISFEWWFYMMFYPLHRWVRRDHQKLVVFGLCGLGLIGNLVAPNTGWWFLTFFLIWWAGVELAREFMATGTVTVRRQRGMLAMLAVPTVWFAVLTWQQHRRGEPITFFSYPFSEFRLFLMSLVFLAVMFAWRRLKLVGFDSLFGLFRYLAPVSFGIYLIHYPLICHWSLWGDPSHRVLDLVIRVGVVFVLAWVLEGPVQNWVNRLSNRWLAKLNH